MTTAREWLDAVETRSGGTDVPVSAPDDVESGRSLANRRARAGIEKAIAGAVLVYGPVLVHRGEESGYAILRSEATADVAYQAASRAVGVDLADVPAMVAALREARAEVERLRASSEDCVNGTLHARAERAEHALSLASSGDVAVAAIVARGGERVAELTAERDEARVAIARVRALCAGADDSEYTTVFAAAVLAALDARDDPSATTTIPIDVAREHAWLANHALEMLVDTGDGTYHPIADALAKVRDLLDPSATTEGAS